MSCNHRIGPLVLGSQDRTLKIDNQEIQFPVLPFKWAPYLVQAVVSRRHAGAWRFCPSTFWGVPRGTKFLDFKSESCRDGRKRGGGKGILVAQVLIAVVVLLGVWFGGDGLGWK